MYVYVCEREREREENNIIRVLRLHFRCSLEPRITPGCVDSVFALRVQLPANYTLSTDP